jgi:ribosomal-protein-alanine N-acetyltransferase
LAAAVLPELRNSNRSGAAGDQHAGAALLAGAAQPVEPAMLPQLETPRLLLREVALDDGPALQAFQSTPSHVSRQAMEPEEFADGTLRVNRYLQYRGEGERRRLFVYVAMLRGDDRVIATVSLSRPMPGIGSFGISMDEAYAGRGLASEMAARLVAFGFEDLKLHRIEADVALENEPCIRLLERIGMVREGVLRDCIRAQGRWWTEAKYAILEHEHARRAHERSMQMA